jgi:RNA polymerase sigma-70 factor, ECF subfamily
MIDRTKAFERHRKHITALAYRMLGSVSEAEDAAQDAFLRWAKADGAEIRSEEAWLVSVTTRICIDRLRRLATEREAYAGNWLPEPIVGTLRDQPDRRLDLASDLSMAFLMVLERLSPEERAVFILHDVFDSSFTEIASIVGKNEAACRQMARRARGRVRQDRPRFQVSQRARKQIIQKFLVAMQSADATALMAVLADEAVLKSDGGGKVKVSSTGIYGADRIARLIQRGHLVPRHLRAQAHRVVRQIAPVNGEPGIVTFLDGKPISTLSLTTDGLRVLAIYQMLNPDKLTHVAPLAAPGRRSPKKQGGPHGIDIPDAS